VEGLTPGEVAAIRQGFQDYYESLDIQARKRFRAEAARRWPDDRWKREMARRIAMRLQRRVSIQNIRDVLFYIIMAGLRR